MRRPAHFAVIALLFASASTLGCEGGARSDPAPLAPAEPASEPPGPAADQSGGESGGESGRPLEPSPVEPTPVVPAIEADVDATDAVAAYRAAVAAFARGDRAAYGDAYAESLRCFFGRSDQTRADVLSARRPLLDANAAGAGAHRLHTIELRRIRSTADEVELADFGWAGPHALTRTRFHQKRVVLARAGDGVWRIVAENPLGASSCGFTPYDEPAPWLWTSLRQGLRNLIDSCEGPPGSTMEDGYPGIGGSNGCDPLLNFDVSEPCETLHPRMGAAQSACHDRVEAEGMLLAGLDGE